MYGMKKNTQILGGSLFGGLALYVVAVMPVVAFAASGASSDLSYLKDFGNNAIELINETLVPLVFAVALVMFIWGLFMTFIMGSDNPEKQKEGKQLMLWGIIAFFVMVSVWGLVNILTGIAGVGSVEAPTTPIVNEK